MSDERPIFSSIGRHRGSGDGRSAGMLLVVGIGLALAVGSFLWQEMRRQWIHTVTITQLPEEAAAAEAMIEKQLEDTRNVQPAPP